MSRFTCRRISLREITPFPSSLLSKKTSGVCLARVSGKGRSALQDSGSEIDLAAAESILRYFLRNPQAADDMEGVVRFRLLNEAIHRNVKEARVTLDWLVAKNLLLEEKREASSTMYRLNPDGIEEIEKFVKQREVERRAETGE
jgi:hypothetical protein